MPKERIIETTEGIQEELDVLEYDVFARTMRDRGWMETGQIIKSGIVSGLALEVGSGPGYLGLEWLKHTDGTTLEGLDISSNMLRLAEHNATDYGLSSRARYVLGNAASMPFEDNRFDAVFTSGSLHEWETPLQVLNEIDRVLKPGGRFLMCDLRRDLPFLVRQFFYATLKPRSMRAGLTSSLQASYTIKEIEEITAASPFKHAEVHSDLFGLSVSGIK